MKYLIGAVIVCLAIYAGTVIAGVGTVSKFVTTNGYQQDIGFSDGTPLFPNVQLQDAKSVQ